MEATKGDVASSVSPRRWLSASGAVFCLLAVIFVAVRLLNLPTFCLDSDEVWSLSLARGSWSDLFGGAGFDIVHPPLFYILLKLWVYIGGISLVWVRLLPALFSFAALVPFYFLCRSLRLSLWQTNFALALLCLNIDQVFHSQYVRMYSLLFLLSLCSYCAFVKYLTAETRQWRALVVLSVVNIFAVYAHYYGWAVVTSEGLCLLLIDRKRLNGFLASTAAVAACFVPWLLFAGHFAAMRGGLKQNLGWIPRPKILDLFGFYASLTGSLAQPALSALFLTVCGILLFIGSRKRARVQTALDRWRVPLLLSAALLPPLVSFGVSQFASESVWGSRHLVIAAVPYYILIAIALPVLPMHRLRPAAAVLAACWGVAAILQITHPQLRVNYEVLAEQMVAREPGPQHLKIVSLDPYLGFPLGFHLDRHAPGRWETDKVKAFEGVYAVNDRHFWIAYHAERWKGVPPRELLTQHGYRVGDGIWVSDQWARIVALPVWRPERLSEFASAR